MPRSPQGRRQALAASIASPVRAARLKQETVTPAPKPSLFEATALPAHEIPDVKPPGRYHHGNLRAALIRAATVLLRGKGLAGLSLRGAARAAGVSQTAPYRHFKDREALLAAVAATGFSALIVEIEQAGRGCGGDAEDAVVAMGGAYIRFATEEPALFQLMFGRDIADRRAHPELVSAMDTVSTRIGEILRNPALGIGIWAAMHGLAWLLVEDVTGLGEGDPTIIPGRAEIVLRSLLAHLVEA